MYLKHKSHHKTYFHKIFFHIPLQIQYCIIYLISSKGNYNTLDKNSPTGIGPKQVFDKSIHSYLINIDDSFFCYAVCELLNYGQISELWFTHVNESAPTVKLDQCYFIVKTVLFKLLK